MPLPVQLFLLTQHHRNPRDLSPNRINMKPSIIWTCLLASTATASWWTTEKPSCAQISGVSQGIAYRYYAHPATGGSCVTSEWNNAIQASIEHSFEKLDLSCLPDSTCVPVDHDGEWSRGAWRGYLLYGPEGKVKLTKYCGPTIEFKLKPSSDESRRSGNEL